jgi:L-asparaginase
MTLQDADRILAEIEEAQRAPGVEAIIVAHGTDMMEEVAFLAALMRSGTKPVVFTGAQRPPGDEAFDGAANLRLALRVAQSPDAAKLGVAIVFGGRILDAQRARKVSSSDLDAFGPDHACLGEVNGRTVRIHSASAQRACFPRLLPDPNVAIAPVALATPAAALRGLAQPPIRGIVVEAPGRGNAPAALVDAVAAACNAGTVVVLASAAAAGGVRPLYESGDRLIRAGAIAAADLDARKARLLLAYALGGGRDSVAAKAIVQAYLRSL